jgi:hypothetical protein
MNLNVDINIDFLIKQPQIAIILPVTQEFSFVFTFYTSSFAIKFPSLNISWSQCWTALQKEPIYSKMPCQKL